MEVHEIQHSMKRRTSWHDYSRKGTYMLTLVVKERKALLGTLKGCLEGETDPYVEYSALGSAIVMEEQKKISRYYPHVGGVPVSAAISPKEKEVLREALNLGYNIILLRENGFPKLYKPSGEAFDACAKGLLSQISPWDFHQEKRVITRAQCLHLNEMAEKIAGDG